MNRVIEAQKAADANLIMRREETAAMRSQANTARLLDNNPTLMRLRELDVLEKVAGNSKLNVVLGERGLLTGSSICFKPKNERFQVQGSRFKGYS